MDRRSATGGGGAISGRVWSDFKGLRCHFRAIASRRIWEKEVGVRRPDRSSAGGPGRSFKATAPACAKPKARGRFQRVRHQFLCNFITLLDPPPDRPQRQARSRQNFQDCHLRESVYYYTYMYNNSVCTSGSSLRPYPFATLSYLVCTHTTESQFPEAFVAFGWKRADDARNVGLGVRVTTSSSSRDPGVRGRRVVERHAVREMEVDPSKSLCRRRLQTAMSCFGQKPWW